MYVSATGSGQLPNRPARGRGSVLRYVPLLLACFLTRAGHADAQEPAETAETDSIAVVERGTPGAGAWDVVEAPFRVLQLPLVAFGHGVRWLLAGAESGHWVPWLMHYQDELARRGLHPAIGGQGPNSGPGLQMLVGLPPDGGGAPWGHVRGAATLKKYWEVEGRVGTGGMVGGAELDVEGFGTIERRAEDEFFGPGRDSRLDDRTDFELKRYEAGLAVAYRVTRRLEASTDLRWRLSESGPGLDDDVPPVDAVFDTSAAPGFGRRWRHLGVGGSLLWQMGPWHTKDRRGTHVGLGFRRQFGLTSGAADYHRYEVDLGFETPFDRRRRSVALGARYEGLRPVGSGLVPFYDLPTLGGPGTLPSFRWHRFRDRDLVLGLAEYRFRTWSDPLDSAWLDLSLFANSGRVARDLSREFRPGRLRTSLGGALSLITGEARLARLELARGGEGTRLNFTFGADF